MRKLLFAPSLFLATAALTAASCLAQSENTTLAMPSAAIPSTTALPSAGPALASETVGTLTRIGVGLHLSSLGPGAEVAYELTGRINIRGGFNYFNLSQNFDSHGIQYGGSLKFESGEARLDYFLWRSLHVSPGLLISNGTLFGGTIAVPAGQSFSINHDNYTSEPTDPLSGTGALKFNTVAPSILFGVGDLVPRGRHHFSVRLEGGGAFRGSPTIGLNFAGGVCTMNGGTSVCTQATSNAPFQSDVSAQQTKYNNDLSFLKFYPIISLGFGIRL